MQRRTLTTSQVTLAFVVAGIADVIQIPLTALMFSVAGAPFAECFDITMGIAVFVLLSIVLGFHWAMLPLFILEVIPALDVLPSWTAYVAYVVWSRKKEGAHGPPSIDAIEVQSVQPTPGPSVMQPPIVLPAESQPSAPASAPTDARLQMLENLRQREFITQAEYDAKREQILREI